MPICELTALSASPAKGRSLLGLDIGEKTIGLAVSDPGWAIASPLQIIERRKWPQDLAALTAVSREREIGGLIVGLPRNMDGTEGPRAQSVRAVAQNLLAHADLTALPLAFWDERLSTAAMERFLIGEDVTRKRRGEVIDKMAAAYILQGALDALKAKP
ncbi:MAG: Holliday junction resolvase RuvX [Alphaproteobacteria bacterium]